MKAVAELRPRRSRQGPRRRASEIIEAAAQVFADKGFHGATTQDIADVLGIWQASLYYYFPSKEAALEQVCTRGVEGFLEAAAEIVASPGTATEKVRRLIESHLTPVRDRTAFVKVFLKERQHLPDESRRRIGRLSRSYERLIEGVFKTGVAAGEFRADLDCRLATLGFLGMLNAASMWYGKEGGATIERMSEEFGRLLLDGMQAAPAPRARRGMPRS
jgi:TetR/AcrR family transcriptional regulator, cholesterol catabolism regulator